MVSGLLFGQTMEESTMKRSLFVLMAGLALMLTARVSTAHHSFSAEFDENKPVTLKGTLQRMDWVNPHGWIYVDVKDAAGKVTTWGVEAGAPNALLRRGLRKTDFQSGIEVIVTGYLAKNGTPTVNGRTVKLPDGREFFTGSSAGNGAP
jgi:hypothetical protein